MKGRKEPIFPYFKIYENDNISGCSCKYCEHIGRRKETYVRTGAVNCDP
jgi:hypothetical protein